MAEDVQTALDDMVPALKDLQDRRVFSANEIHQIVDRRRNSEYDTRRRSAPRLADFLRYIHDEKLLEALRQLRVKKVKEAERQERPQQKGQNSEKDKEEEGEGEGEASKTKIGDHHIVKLIHSLWKRTLVKFGKKDVGLYLQYADFCKEVRAHAQLSRTLAEAMQLFPREEGLWIEAASHEFFEMGSIQNARVLLQRGIRLMARSQDLWLQQFSLELHFVEKLRARRSILKGDECRDDHEPKPSGDQYKIVRVVYKNAIAAIPDSVTFRLKFWDQCRLFSDTEDLRKEIVDSIRTDLCKENAEAWMAWALYQWEQKQQSDLGDHGEQNEGSHGDDDDHNSEAKEPFHKKRKVETNNPMSVLDVLRQATENLATEEMYLKAIRMITRYIANMQEEEEEDEEDPDVSKGIDLLEKLFGEAERSAFFSSELVMEQALFLTRLDRKDESSQCLERFVRNRRTEDALKVWIHLAELSEEGPTLVLQRALEKTDMNHPTYYDILLHLFGAKLQAKDDRGLHELFEKISLLTPGFLPLNEIEEPIFGVRHALDVCLLYLQFLNGSHETLKARKVYRKVISESSLGSIFAEFDESSLVDFLNEAAKVEENSNEEIKKRQKNLVRMYEEAAKLFGDSELGMKFKEKKRQVKLCFPSTSQSAIEKETSVQALDANARESFVTTFHRYQFVHLKNARSLVENKRSSSLHYRHLADLFEKLNEEDKSTWCIETFRNHKKIVPRHFLSLHEDSQRGYCSFLVQKDKRAYENFQSRVPLENPIPGIEWDYSAGAFWIFFGINPQGNAVLQGRPEHTDSVSNDGTWHFQLSGTKSWFIRPTPQLLEHLKDKDSDAYLHENTRIRIDCEEGDILCINTRLWFHSTIIPPQNGPSVSYARDFFIKSPSLNDSGQSMTNLEGLYATNEIEEGTIIFTETSMPDCEMHRSNRGQHNCKVVELEDGTSAVVSVRPIRAGEFFSVEETDDEEEDDDVEE